MFSGNPFRFQNSDGRTAPAPRSVPAAFTSQSSSSLAATVHSSAVTPTLPTAQLPTSRQSDTVDSDHLTALRTVSSTTSPKGRFFPLSINPTPRSSSLAHMGQSVSRTDASLNTPSTPTSPPPLPLPPTASGRLRRVWGGRRKKSEDASAVLDRSQPNEMGVAFRASSSNLVGTSTSSVDSSEVPTPSYERPPSRTKLFMQPFSLGVLRPRNPVQQPKAPKFSGSPPVPPPKPTELQSSKKTPSPPSGSPEQSASPVLASPSISAAIHFITHQEEGRLDVPTARPPKPDAETKQDWRKSDSTVISYVTVRPGALSGSRSPRPVSLAESSHSGHTIVPVTVNKRLSALIADPDFAMAEESDSDIDDDDSRAKRSQRPSPVPSVKARNRRSASMSHGLNLGARSKTNTPEPLKPSVSESSIPPPRMSTDQLRLTPTVSRDTPTLSKNAARGIIAPTAAPGAAHTTGSSIRGRLAALTAVASSSERVTIAPPPQHPHRPNPATNPTFRQTAVSMTGGFAPAALGLGKRAAEKVHRVWGGLSSSTSTYSGYSSTTSLTGSTSGTPSSTSGRYPDAVDRTASGQSTSTQPSTGGWMRRTPNAPSGSWSVNSSATSSSVSDPDAFATSNGPLLGTRLRGPTPNGVGGSVIGGMVFGRHLQHCVRETAIDRVKLLFGVRAPEPTSVVSGIRPLEERLLPALVVRCAQHISHWGLQEEGLFRVSGRPTHVARLRSEFDTGADYMLSECEPGDLDPHAVASIFKAYLRELPESLLTASLLPEFEAALASPMEHNDSDTSSASSQPYSLMSSPGALPRPMLGGLPLLRKPPSLSTLAMPSFAGAVTISPGALQAITSLMSRLPLENRDLLYTVVELLQATAARSKETKMTLGNLLLVFCPSLNMSPPLLRCLCEAKTIWDAPVQGVDSPDPSDAVSPSDDHVLNAATADPGVILLDDNDYDSDYSDLPAARPRNGPRRGPVTAMLHVPDLPGASPYRSSGGSSGQDDSASYVSALDRAFSRPSSATNDSSHNLPALTSSTDSLATPSTMSEVSSLQSPTHVLTDNLSREKLEPIVTTVPIIAGPTDAPLPSTTSRRGLISPPMPFVSGPATNAPRTPVSPRKSIALLSFPPLGKSEPSTPHRPTMTHRSKRPSLSMLFSKKSSASLASQQSNSLTVESSHSAPLTSSPSYRAMSPTYPAKTAPPSFVDDVFAPRTAASSSSALNAKGDLRGRKDSTATSLFSTPQSTPIADYFCGQSGPPSPSSPEAGEDDAQPAFRYKLTTHDSPSRTSLTPSIDIGLEDTVEGNWAQSVLLEAQAQSSASRSRWSVKDAIKKFEGRA